MTEVRVTLTEPCGATDDSIIPAGESGAIVGPGNWPNTVNVRTDDGRVAWSLMPSQYRTAKYAALRFEIEGRDLTVVARAATPEEARLAAFFVRDTAIGFGRTRIFDTETESYIAGWWLDGPFAAWTEKHA